jgi:mRNA-degrading endonuclease RelE of RelBE toxin-antitoxin system
MKGPDGMPFEILYTSTAQRELKKLDAETQRRILQESLALQEAPFPRGARRKKIQGFSFPCYRLRIDTSSDSFRLFYGIDRDRIHILRVVSKKEADRVIRSLRKSSFPPG